MAVENPIFYARIKPLRKGKQHVSTYSVFGKKLQAGKWYKLTQYITATVNNKVDEVDLMDYMKNARNEHHVDSDCVFDVVSSQREAEEIERREALEDEQKSPVAFAVDLAGGAQEATAKRRPGRPRKNPPVDGSQEPADQG